VAAQAATEPALSRPAPLPGWVSVAGGMLVGAAAAELALLEVFYVPLRAGRVVLPLSVVAAMVFNVLLPRLMYLTTRSRWAATLPAVLWLVVVVGLSIGRPEGDVVLPGTPVGLALLFGGAGAAAYGVARAVPPPAGRRRLPGRVPGAHREPR
jgi:hypothetical protein